MLPSVELLRTRNRLYCRTLYAFPPAIFPQAPRLNSRSTLPEIFSTLASHFLYCIFFSLSPPSPFSYVLAVFYSILLRVFSVFSSLFSTDGGRSRGSASSQDFDFGNSSIAVFR
jgi:hypothetical protein